MLLGEDGGGDEDGDLFAGEDDLERGAHGDLGLAEADIAADEAVHGAGGFEVVFGLVDGAELVRGFLVEEGALEFALPGRVGREGEAGLGGAGGLEARSSAARSRTARWPGPLLCPSATQERLRGGTTRPAPTYLLTRCDSVMGT